MFFLLLFIEWQLSYFDIFSNKISLWPETQVIWSHNLNINKPVLIETIIHYIKMKIALLRMQLNWLVHVFLLFTYIFLIEFKLDFLLNWNKFNLFLEFPNRNDDSHWTQMMYKYYVASMRVQKENLFLLSVCLLLIFTGPSISQSFHPSSCWLLQINTYWAISETNSDAMSIPNFMGHSRSSALSRSLSLYLYLYISISLYLSLWMQWNAYNAQAFHVNWFRFHFWFRGIAIFHHETQIFAWRLYNWLRYFVVFFHQNAFYLMMNAAILF